MSSRRTFLVSALAAIFLVAGIAPLALAEEKAPKPYPLDFCLVSAEKLGEHGDPIVKVHDGQEFKFCCKSCVKDFDKDPAKWHAKLKEEVARTEKEKKG